MGCLTAAFFFGLTSFVQIRINYLNVGGYLPKSSRIYLVKNQCFLNFVELINQKKDEQRATCKFSFNDSQRDEDLHFPSEMAFATPSKVKSFKKQLSSSAFMDNPIICFITPRANKSENKLVNAE